jgi:hypothetical protein
MLYSIFSLLVTFREAHGVVLSMPQSEKWDPYILFLTIMVIGLRKPYIMKEVDAGLELYDVYCRLGMWMFNVASKYLVYM